MKGLSRTKETKTHIYRCQMEEPRHRRPYQRPASLQVEACHRKVTHAPTQVEEDAEEKINTWRRVDHWLIPGFLLAGRLGLDTPGGGVADRR